MSECKPQFTKKYLSRPSPNFPANKCRGQTLVGNDGKNMYLSKQGSNGVYRWVKLKKEPISKILKDEQKRKKIKSTKSRKPRKTSVKSRKPRKTSVKSRKPRKTSVKSRKPKKTSVKSRKPKKTSVKSRKLKKTSVKSRKPYTKKTTKLKQKMFKDEEDEKYVEVKFECKSEEFIQILYDILRKGRDNCFTEGAFVISDENGEVLNLLTETCLDDKKIKYDNNYRSSTLGIITHDSFLRENIFNQGKVGVKLHKNFLIDNGLLVEGYTYNGYKQFENKIRDKNHKPKTLEFLCNPICNEKKDNEECIEARRNSKSVILFYPFVVEKDAGMGFKEYKQYLYLKLEENPHVSVGHVKDAVCAYAYPVYNDASGFDRRRERFTCKNEQKYKDKFKTKDLNFYREFYGKNDEELSKLQLELEFYNDSVRANDEFYIPQRMTNDILKNLS